MLPSEWWVEPLKISMSREKSRNIYNFCFNNELTLLVIQYPNARFPARVALSTIFFCFFQIQLDSFFCTWTASLNRRQVGFWQEHLFHNIRHLFDLTKSHVELLEEGRWRWAGRIWEENFTRDGCSRARWWKKFKQWWQWTAFGFLYLSRNVHQ